MSWKVLVSAPYMQPVLDRFRPVFDQHGIELVVPPVNERLSEAELLRWVGDIDGAICGDDRFTERVLRAAPRLKVISKWGTGIDSIDQEAARTLGIAVCRTPNAFTDAVADTTLGYILCCARQLAWMDQDVRQGHWSKRRGVSLHESTVGILGLGNIGRAVARRMAAFGGRMVGYDAVAAAPEFLAETGLQLLSKEELLRQSDFVTLHCDLNPATYHTIDEAALALMKPTAYVINTARGPLVSEAALVAALRAERIAGAALDVFEVEPLPEHSELRQFERVLLGTHNSNSSPEAWERVHHNTIQNLLAGLTNGA